MFSNKTLQKQKAYVFVRTNTIKNTCMPSKIKYCERGASVWERRDVISLCELCAKYWLREWSSHAHNYKFLLQNLTYTHTSSLSTHVAVFRTRFQYYGYLDIRSTSFEGPEMLQRENVENRKLHPSFKNLKRFISEKKTV